MIIKLKFLDFWPSFNTNDNIFIQIISENFQVIVADDPDYIIYSDYGNEYLKYDCIKIYYTAENLVPNFNLCDYGIGCTFINFQDRYLRIPLHTFTEPLQNTPYKNLKLPKKIDKNLVNRKFCNFIYSNSSTAHPLRLKFLLELSKYKKVDCGGSINNNIGRKIENKLAFISDYKFSIAFENSSVDGYTTEKIVEPMLVNSIPIYWGNPKINMDFNDESFIIVNNDTCEAVSKAIEKIIDLDTNNDKYIETLEKPWLKEGQYFNFNAPLSLFLEKIFSQPIEHASRKARYGANMIKSKEIVDLWRQKEQIKNKNFFQKIFSLTIKNRMIWNQNK